MDRAEVGKKINRSRELLGLSMRGLAERSGVDHSFVGRIERGEANVTLDTLLRVTKALDLVVEIEQGTENVPITDR